MSYVLTKDFVACVPVSHFFLTAAHFYLAGFSLLTASISHFFNRRYKIFMLFFQQNSSPFFISRSSSFSLTHVSVDIKTKTKKNSTLSLFFFSLKVWVATRFRAKNRLIELFYIGMPVVWTYARARRRTVT